jgi:hypothetical protein
MDAVDVASLHDFNDESVLRARSKTHEVVRRGSCLYCYEPLESHLIYCDDDCRADYEDQELKLKRTRK